MKFSTLLQAAAYSCALVFAVCSCNTEASVQNEFLNTRNIPGQFFKVDGQTDTVLKTSHASLIRIKKGTFGGTVDIEIKEVFTPQEIFQSGLATISDGRPLRSAGMIYFSATLNGEKVEPGMPISIGIATKNIDTAMKLFKGEWTEDSTMNWTDPESLDSPDLKNDTTEINAVAIFHGKCTSCHHVTKDLTGPALRGLNLRGPWKNPLNLVAWINNPGRFMAYDAYTQSLKAKFGSIMTAFPELSLDVVIAITKYINEVTPQQFEANDSLYHPRYPVISSGDTSRHYDQEYYKDCGSDTIYYNTEEGFSEYDTTIPPAVVTDIGINSLDDKWYKEHEDYLVNTARQRYDFKIEANGWYNIDAFLKPDVEVKNVRLEVRVNTSEKVFLNTFIFVPSRRVMLQSTKQEEQLYKFMYNEDGTLPLTIGYRAIAVTFGSVNDRIMYGVKEFVISNDQTIKLELLETTKEKLQNILLSQNIDGISLEAIEKQQAIIPKPCDQ